MEIIFIFPDIALKVGVNIRGTPRPGLWIMIIVSYWLLYYICNLIWTQFDPYALPLVTFLCLSNTTGWMVDRVMDGFTASEISIHTAYDWQYVKVYVRDILHIQQVVLVSPSFLGVQI